MNRLAHTSSENDAQTLRDLSKSKVVFKRFVLSKQNSKDFQLFFFLHLWSCEAENVWSFSLKISHNAPEIFTLLKAGFFLLFLQTRSTI